MDNITVIIMTSTIYFFEDDDDDDDVLLSRKPTYSQDFYIAETTIAR